MGQDFFDLNLACKFAFVLFNTIKANLDIPVKVSTFLIARSGSLTYCGPAIPLTFSGNLYFPNNPYPCANLLVSVNMSRALACAAKTSAKLSMTSSQMFRIKTW